MSNESNLFQINKFMYIVEEFVLAALRFISECFLLVRFWVLGVSCVLRQQPEFNIKAIYYWENRQKMPDINLSKLFVLLKVSKVIMLRSLQSETSMYIISRVSIIKRMFVPQISLYFLSHQLLPHFQGLAEIQYPYLGIILWQPIFTNFIDIH